MSDNTNPVNPPETTEGSTDNLAAAQVIHNYAMLARSQPDTPAAPGVDGIAPASGRLLGRYRPQHADHRGTTDRRRRR
ncbi:hypothetical protein AB0M43_36330 [Longispora sp. NPDC051575]|uniref:hypothetical protein n=1 Tax=Longispora sp. NPDC051575 TaxID=3154943 RepID=UPI00341859D2